MKLLRINSLRISVLIVFMLSLQFCFAPKNVLQEDSGPTTFYDTDIQPIMVRSCTPCHFPEKGRKKILNTYTAVSTNIQDILERIQLAPEDEHFMPFKGKRQALSAEEILLFKKWFAEGMTETKSGK